LLILRGYLRNITLLIGDVTDSFRMLDVVQQVQPDYVYHFAAQAINGISYDNAALTLAVNVQGTFNLLEAIRRSGIFPTVLLAGSSTEYGRSADIIEGAISETAPLLPVSPYGSTKVATEMLGLQYYAAHRIPVIIARFFIQVGPGGTDSLAIQQFCRQIALAELRLSPQTISHGNLASSRDITDVRESAAIVVRLAETGSPGEAYNIGTGSSVSMEQMLSLAVAQSRIPITLHQDPARFRVYDERVLLADVQKLRDLTGWRPSIDMKYTVAAILDYWRMRVATLYDVVSA
jgi:nucleoside-diphosphate-sugar epimerase